MKGRRPPPPAAANRQQVGRSLLAVRASQRELDQAGALDDAANELGER